MHNVTHMVDGNHLVITVDISEHALKSAPLSSSGKTKLVATTGGAVNVGDVSFSLNVMGKK